MTDRSRDVLNLTSGDLSLPVDQGQRSTCLKVDFFVFFVKQINVKIDLLDQAYGVGPLPVICDFRLTQVKGQHV